MKTKKLDTSFFFEPPNNVLVVRKNLLAKLDLLIDDVTG